MLKKILFLGFTVSILIFSNNLFAEINSVVPLKKPVLSKEEIQKKISINILKPLKKPCLLYTSPSPRDMRRSRMPSSA